MTINMDQQTSAALKWLYEMEAIDSPVLRANLYENIFLSDPGIIDCAAWLTPTFTYQKGVLVWIKLNRRTKWFRKEEAYSRVKEVIKGLLPSYDVRIVEDRNILDMAQKRVEEIYGGKHNETINESNKTDCTDTSSQGDISPSSDELPKESDILPDPEKQTEDRQKVCNDSEQLDPQIEQKAQSIVNDLYSDPNGGE